MAEIKKRLGRGLDSLLSSTRLRELESQDAETAVETPVQQVAVEGRLSDRVLTLPLDKINTNPHQPRQNWDESKLIELAESIKANGLIQPILIRPMGEGFQLIAGERRLRASEMAGLGEIPAIIRDASEEQMVEWALIENIHRSDLNPLERAQAYCKYIQRFSLSQQEAAQRLGEDRSTIANYMRLTELPGQIKQMLAGGAISMGHARALLGVADYKEQLQLAEQAARQNLTVRDLERRIRQVKEGQAKETKPVKEKSANIVELEREMTRNLGMKVTIKTAGKGQQRGKVIIEFYSLDDFDRLRERLI